MCIQQTVVHNITSIIKIDAIISGIRIASIDCAIVNAVRIKAQTLHVDCRESLV
jgi:hypothetical protein